MKKSKKLQKLMNKGFRGYPIATIAYSGPDDKNATKVMDPNAPNVPFGLPVTDLAGKQFTDFSCNNRDSTFWFFKSRDTPIYKTRSCNRVHNISSF